MNDASANEVEDLNEMSRTGREPNAEQIWVLVAHARSYRLIEGDDPELDSLSSRN